MPERPRRSFAVRALALAATLALAWLLVLRAQGPGTIPASVLGEAAVAGCDDLERPVEADPSRSHLVAGEAFAYADPPPAEGPHDPTPLPGDPHVYREPVSDTRAVHNLEHAYVIIWYRPTADDGLSAATIEALERLADREDRVIMAPSPNLPTDRSLALVAWNTRWMCPAGLSAEQATQMAEAFIDAYRGTTNAPEAPRGLLGRLFSG